jgi:glycosyltransferase involved in cell wall biosynthesis
VSALVPYKKIDLAIKAFNRLNYPLVIAGEGPESVYLKKKSNKNITFLGWQSQDQLAGLFSQCKAFIFPGEEDFGIAPVEAMASGRPVIAYAKGGALETVTKETGIFFKEQTVESLIEAILLFEREKFNPEKIREHALRFDKEIFKKKFRDYVEKHISC